MIRCLQCGFENPDDHNFCQKCGSTISGTSPVSDVGDAVNVAFEMPEQIDSSMQQPTVEMDSVASATHHQQEQDAVVTETPHRIYSEWLAVLSPLEDRLRYEVNGESANLAEVTELLQQKLTALQDEGYLDSGQRYRVKECHLKTREFRDGLGLSHLEVVVFDDRPDQPSCLDEILRKHSGVDITYPEAAVHDIKHPLMPPSARESESAESDAPNTDALSMSSSNTTDAVINEEQNSDQESVERIEDSQLNEIGQFDSLLKTGQEFGDELPDVASVYLTIQDQFYPSLPQVHDAWIEDTLSVIIVENRNVFQSLQQALQEPEIKALQVLHWFHEMTELWAVLQPKNYHQSLLDTSNLRVDEDHILCITCLYASLSQDDVSLAAMGKVWLQLIEGSLLRDDVLLINLCDALRQGRITSIDELRFRLEDVAMQLHDEAVDLPRFGLSDDAPHLSTLELERDTIQLEKSTVDSTVSSQPLYSEVKGHSDTVESFPGQDTAEDILDVYPLGDETPTVVLPMRLFHLVDAGITDIGRQRDHNEDYFSIQSETQKHDTPAGRTFEAKGLYVLCDGMGGHAAGEVASAMAVSTLENYFAEVWTDQFPSREDIRTAIQKANQSIYDLNQENACYGSGRMGTTLVMLLVDGIKVAIAHVGDSRLYRFCRRTGLEQITIDHEVGQREIQRGVDPDTAYARPDAYQLTQALGPRDGAFINPDIQTFEVNEDMLFILCSDGLSDNNLLEQYCESHVEPMLSSQVNLYQELHQLIDLANQHNGHDNITAVAVRMKVRPKIQGVE